MKAHNFENHDITLIVCAGMASAATGQYFCAATEDKLSEQKQINKPPKTGVWFFESTFDYYVRTLFQQGDTS